MLSLNYLRSLSWLLILQSAVLSRADHMFTAIARHERLRPRGLNFVPRFGEHTLLYANGIAPDILQAAKVSLHPKLPVLAIDDIVGHLKHMQCDAHSAQLCFRDDATLLLAEQSWKAAHDFIMITQELGCAPIGEHATYTASYRSTNISSLCINLDTIPKTLKECSNWISLDLGSHIVQEVAPTLQPRQALPTTSTAATSSKLQTASSAPTTAIVFSPPSIPPTATSLSYKFDSFSYIDNTILPPPAPLLALLPSNYAPPPNLQLKCLNCTLGGSLSLNAMNLNWTSNSSMVKNMDAAIDFFDNGWLEFNADDISANMSFEMQFQPGLTLEYVVKLPDIPLGGISIAGIVELGLMLSPTFPIGITFDSTVTFRTGFELQIPKHSKIVLNVSDIHSSSVTGFQDSTIRPLPFSAKAQNPSLTFFTGFQPLLVLGAGVGAKISEASASGGAGIFLDLPQLQAEVEVLHNVSDSCSGTAPKGESNTFIHVKPAAYLSVNDLFELDVNLLSIPFALIGSQNLYNYTKPLKEQCLKLDSKTHSTVPATVPASAGGGTKNAANRLSNAPKGQTFLALALLQIFMMLA